MEAKLQTVKLEKHRAEFVKLLAANINYFGTYPETKLKAIMPMKQNTQYEELTCIGLYPERNLLEGTIAIKLPYGYDGDLCSGGSTEYVRFFIDWDEDGDFSEPDEDVGMVSLTVHNIPGDKPLEYCVSLAIDPKKKPCTTVSLLKVRGILSWNAPPTPGNPDFDPPWGNKLDARIQIHPRALKIADVVKDVKLSPAVLSAIDVNMDISQPKKLTPVELTELYKGKDVPELRFNVKRHIELAKLIKKQPNLIAKYQASPAFFPKDVAQTLGSVMANLGTILEPPVNVKYEELKCVGLSYGAGYDTLVGTLTVKLPYGYSGNLCTPGSQEYVAFWVDWNNDGFGADDYVGTASVTVHDIQNIPPGGMQYACFIPADFVSYQKPCGQPVVLRVRALLSWETPPDPSNPNWPPVWGNSVETLIQIKALPLGVPEVIPGHRTPFIDSVGGMAVSSIGASGYADGVSVSGGFTAQDSPFGAVIAITGKIANAPNLSAGETPLKYKVLYRNVTLGQNFQPLTNTFRIWIDKWDGTNWSQSPIDQAPDTASGYYTYQEDIKVTPTDLVQQFVTGSVLGQWLSNGVTDDLYELKIVTDTGEESNVVQVRVDNTLPQALLDVTTKNAVPIKPGDCAIDAAGFVLGGQFTASDDHFGYYQLYIEPSGMGGAISVGGASQTPSEQFSESYSTLAAPGRSDTFTLNTSGMKPCGYILHLKVRDRTIVNSGSIGYWREAVRGFCVM